MTEPGGAEPVVISRVVDLEVSTDELWNMVADGDRWGDWLAERSDVIVEPDQEGVVIDDDGVERSVAIHSVVPGERVRFAWWPTDRPGESSMVELLVLPTDHGAGSRLSITEIYAVGPTASSVGASSTSALSTCAAKSAWDLRLMLLVLCLDAVALVRT
jgi:uncharacterized protein YndB with AHSA1/START domain